MRNITIIIIIIFITVIFASSPVYAQQATLSLSPSTGTFNKGCPFSLDILLNTGGAQTDGTDAILLYDASRVSATSITNGTIYSEYPGNNFNDSSGKVTVSGLASVTSPYAGSGTLVTVNFTVKETAPTGAIQITFDFDPNDKAKTIDSNVVQRGTNADILNSVVNGSYTVGTGTCGASPSPIPGGVIVGGRGAPGGIATPSAQVSQPPKTIDQLVDYKGKGPGTPELTFTLAIVGSALTILGILGLVLL